MDVVKWSGAVQFYAEKKYALTQYQFAGLTVLWGATATRRRPQGTMFDDKWEPKLAVEPMSSAYQHNAWPLGSLL